MAHGTKVDINIKTYRYQNTTHASTGFAPFYLLCGLHPHLPIDLIFKTKKVNYLDYLKSGRGQCERLMR